ncbi:MAG: bifunctional aspartate kinase/homoserine dehydrogenase I [Flavobacteriaceae bacterium]|nr:MAG: bifunctional aspartate kinase/homoserine dehydrogenase I [Flavobacteriaceae bacterium]
MKQLLHIQIENYTTESGYFYPEFNLSYQLFGLPLGQAPVVLVNHALTGNSNVAGDEGWWKSLIGLGRLIDTSRYSVIAFNIPGNGYDEVEANRIDNYEDFTARDIARLFGLGLEKIGVHNLYAVIGGSLGGGIAWEMAVLFPELIENLIPVASDWKASDWILAHNKTQQQILSNSSKPVHDARMMAMLFYRTADSFKEKFNRTRNEEQGNFNTESWLLHHGRKLEDRFSLPTYKMMNHLLSSVDITRDRGTFNEVASHIRARVTQVGVDSDFFFVPKENKETQKLLNEAGVENNYEEIKSIHGHDAFLIEFEQMEKILTPIFKQPKRKSLKNKGIKVLKFGGKSLANGNGLERVLEIIENKVEQEDRFVVVLSARGNSTDDLEAILEKSKSGEDYKESLESFMQYQISPSADINFDHEFNLLSEIFEGVALLGDYSDKIKDRVLAQGEVLSVKMLSHLLNKRGIPTQAVDSRTLLKTDSSFGEAHVLEEVSKDNFKKYFGKNGHELQLITGFIASNSKAETTTLGRNGSNYSASLIANFLDAAELESYTHVNGIYTANPDLVSNAQMITELSYQEANELASFGANILHAKTIIPLVEKNIPLRLLNTFDKENKGTLIKSHATSKGIRSVTVQNNVSLINLEGRGLLGKIGVDARIFTALGKGGINVSIISQGSSERGIGFVVSSSDAFLAKEILEEEFAHDIKMKDVNRIYVKEDLSIVSIIGQNLSSFHKSYNALSINKINPILINNTITGDNICLVLEDKDLNKAVNVIHGRIFGVSTNINVAIFGVGLVGGTLIEQILKSRKDILKRRNININIFALSNSKQLLLNKDGVGQNWNQELLKQDDSGFTINDVIGFARNNHLENLIAVDNTANRDFIKNYIPLVENGFDLVSSNKIGNTVDFAFYKELRAALKRNEKSYLYETNVGAGLPLVDTIKLLHHSGENITRINGVFSGSLSYLFNNFSEEDKNFSDILQEAVDQGFTEPDPREDLSGNDVARKLLILARELDLENEFEDVKIQNLIPEHLRDGSASDFLSKLKDLDLEYQDVKDAQEEDHVLRYVGVLAGDLSKSKGELEVKLVSVSKKSSLGQVQGSDSIFEIYTESYGERPLVIQGAGAGAKVTARGVFGDILRLTEKAV